MQSVTGCGEKREVAHLGSRIAGDVNDALGGEGEELLKKLLTATCTRRVNDDDGVITCMRHLGKDLASISSQEAAVSEAVDLSIVSRFFDSGLRKLDA